MLDNVLLEVLTFTSLVEKILLLMVDRWVYLLVYRMGCLFTLVTQEETNGVVGIESEWTSC